MPPVSLPDINSAAIEEAVGATSYARGVQYARQNAVSEMWWDPEDCALHGSVQGQAGNVYDTTAYFGDGVSSTFEQGQCSCPVGFNCKHVVALVVTVTALRSQQTASDPRPRPPAWERSLGTLLDPATDRSAGRTGDTPLAIELTLTGRPRRHAARARNAAGSDPGLLARPVRPGRTGWVGGGLTWSGLGSLHYRGEYVQAHVRLLQEMYALYQSRKGGSPYYSYSEDRSIDLSDFDSRRLWPMLDEAAAIGLRLVHSKKRLGTVDKYTSAQLCLDVTHGRSAGALAVTPVLRVDADAADVLPVRFIGAEGHGVIYVSRAEADSVDSADRADRTGKPGDLRPQLARLTRSVPAELQRMVLDDKRLEIPDAGLPRFRDHYFPRLRQVATVVSSDGSFTPPAISDPTLVLHARYGSGHDLDIGWEWAYTVGDTPLRAPLDSTPAEAGYRDPDKERTVLAGLDETLDRFDPLLGPDRALAPHAALGGVDTMRFTTEALPLIADQPGITVEFDGEPPDYREVSDSLRIGVSAGELPGETDWFDLGVTITVEGRQVPFADVIVALSRQQSHLLLPGGAYFSLEKPELRALRTLITEAQAMQDSPGDQLRISRFQAGLWSELAELGVVDHQAQAWQRQVSGLLSIDSVTPAVPPASLVARLRPYQLAGFGWLAFLWEHQLGGILADDMGLGKTVQALALICHARQADPAVAPFLVIAPTSVVSNWAAESARFAPELNVVSISDTVRRRGGTLDDAVAGADVVVTSYTLFRLDFEDYSGLRWAGMILDEAQFTKNHQSKIYQCARRLTAPFKLAITGTPMENNLMELWSLLSIAAPGLFPNPTRFGEYYARPIEKGHDLQLLGQLRRRIKPLVKRRTKEQVAADLPVKQEQTLEVDLHPRHRKIYQTHLQRERQKVLGLVDDMNRNRFTILRSLTLLRQLSLHAGLVGDEHRNLPSAKIDALFEQLSDVIEGGHRALVFSQFTGFLGMVRSRLDAAGMDYCYLDGGTRNRAAVIDRFKGGSVPVFLISLKAGGFGLNLTEADYCFLLDPWWNPATEAQAVDRTHRIGQTRNVMVYRLIARDTIEEKVMALKARKAELFASVIDEGNMFGANLDANDIRDLFV